MTDWGARAEALLIELSQLSEPGPGVTRLPFTHQHTAALDLLTERMEAAGLKVWLDDAGTLIGRLDGPSEAGTFLMGSHQDSGRESGAYDGIMGVVLPIVALEKLKADGAELPFSVEVLAFADEEGVRFPTALLGSRALAGCYDASVLEMKDASGVTLQDALLSFGLNPAAIIDLNRDPADTIGFLETHVEQGPVLEREGEAVGVVTAICGIERHQISVVGETGHAGTLPMEDRRDALVGAAALVTEVNRMARNMRDLRATVGALSVKPNVVNAVPREVQLTAEIRSPSDDTRQAAGDNLHRFARMLSRDTGLEIECRRTYAQAAQPCSRDLSKHLEEAVEQTGRSCLFLPSGATHDASAMADLCPMAMLFVRCRDGVSHRPEEFASAADMHTAVNVLANFLMSLRKKAA